MDEHANFPSTSRTGLFIHCGSCCVSVWGVKCLLITCMLRLLVVCFIVVAFPEMVDGDG